MQTIFRTTAILLALIGLSLQQETQQDFWDQLYKDPRNQRFITSLLNARRQGGYKRDLYGDLPQDIPGLLADKAQYSTDFLHSATEYLDSLAGNVNTRFSGVTRQIHHGNDPTRISQFLSDSQNKFPLLPIAARSQISPNPNIQSPPSSSPPSRNPANTFPLRSVHADTPSRTQVSISVPVTSVPIPAAAGGVVPPDSYFNEDRRIRVDNIPLTISDPEVSPGNSNRPLITSETKLFERDVHAAANNRDLGIVVKGIRGFTLDLLKGMVDMAVSQGNIVFSPVSISSLLSLLTLATRGETKQEISTALQVPKHWKEDQIHYQYEDILSRLNHMSKGITVRTSNRLFVAYDINVYETFRNMAYAHYNASISPEEFRSHAGDSKDKINAWVEKETGGKIKNFLIAPLAPDSKLVAVNTFLFAGKWKIPFDKDFTMKRNFNTGKSILEVPMMVNVMEVPYFYSHVLNVDMVALPYTGDEYSMFIILPKEDPQHRSIESVEAMLDSATIEKLISSLVPETISFAMPRMRISMKTSLTSAMSSLNIKKLFSGTSDFTRMTDSPVFVNDILHEAILEVNEKGTVAAAASAVSMNRIGGTVIVHVNRPAIIFIRDHATGLPLFWARLVTPETL